MMEERQKERARGREQEKKEKGSERQDKKMAPSVAEEHSSLWQFESQSFETCLKTF